MAERLTGKCLCGAVSFAFDAQSTDVDACHCSMCRQWTGGPLMVVQQQGPIAFEGGENIALYASSSAMERGFCKVCGSSLFTKLIGADHYFVSAGAIAEDAKLDLVLEIFFDRKPAYYSFANTTRKMTAEGFAKAWAGETNG